MPLKNLPIQQKLMTVIMVTCSVVLLVTGAAFFAYEFLAYHQTAEQELNTLGNMVADNCTKSLAFGDPAGALEVLSSLRAEPSIVAACLYDKDGKLFAHYPPDLPAEACPLRPATDGYRFEQWHLVGSQPVEQEGDRLGTLYLKSNMAAMVARLRLSGAIALLVIAVSLVVAYGLSKALQRQISRPILALAETAKTVSDRRDYSVRATKQSEDELGLLTDAFNQMLTEIQVRTGALKESEGRMRAVLNFGVSAVVVIDAKGKIMDWNARAERMFGWARAEVLGRELAETIVPPRFREGHRRGLKHFNATGEGPFLNQLIELNALRRDGREFPAELSIGPLKTGEVTTFCGFITDLTERKRQAEVRSRFVAIVESSDDAIISKTLDGIITSWNPSAERLFGFTEAEVVGQSMLMLIPPDRVSEEPETLARIARGESVVQLETVRIRKNGTTVDVAASISPIKDAYGKVIGASTIEREITERKRAEKQEAAFGRLSQSLGAAASASEAAHLIPNTADELFGWDACTLDVYEAEADLVRPIINIDTIDGKRVDVPPSHIGQPPTATMRRVLEQGAQLVLRQPPYGFSPGTIPFGNTGRPSASLMHVPIRRGKKVIGILSVQSYAPGAYNEKALNILQTLADQCGGALERVRAEESFRQLNEELERRVQERTAQLEAANKELEAFSYSVSHDLRAPLRHINGFADILLKDSAAGLGAAGQRHLGVISDAAKRMGALIDDLLVFSRMGRAEMRRTTVNMNELVSEVLQEMAADVAGRNLEWDIGPLPEVSVDRSMLKQVWANLLSNAVKYTRQRERAVIKISCRQNDRGELEFSVQDNGAGFDMKYADKLFGVFQRLHQAEEFEGTGIGLANVRRIIQRHGGRAWAEGKVDTGATFFYTLPHTDTKTA